MLLRRCRDDFDLAATAPFEITHAGTFAAPWATTLVVALALCLPLCICVCWCCGRLVRQKWQAAAAEVEADSRRDAAAKTTGFDEWYSLPSSLVVTAGAGAHTGPHVDENYAAEVAEEEAAKAQAAPGTSGAPQPVTGYGTTSARGNCDAHHHQEQRPLAESVKMLGPPPPLPPATQPPTKRPPPPPPPSALPLPPLPIPVAARLSAPPLRPSRAPQLRPSRAPPTLGRLSD